MATPLVSFEIPYRLYLPEGVLPVKLNDGLYGVQIDYAPVGQVQNGIVAPSGPNVEYSRDVFGYAGRSHVHVIIPEQVDVLSDEGKKRFCDNEEKYISAALAAVNRVVEIYAQFDVNKLGEPSVHVLSITKRYITNTSLIAVDEELNQVSDLAVMLPIGFRPVSQGDVKRTDEVSRRILRYLADGKNVHIYRQLITGALGNLWRQVYRLVPIEASTAVEAFLPLAIERIDASVTVDPELYVYEKLRLLQSTINAKIPAEKQLSWFAPGTKGWKGLSSTEITDWHGKCYEMRNKIIHRGYSDVTHKDAQDAINSATILINYIMIIMNRELHINVDC